MKFTSHSIGACWLAGVLATVAPCLVPAAESTGTNSVPGKIESVFVTPKTTREGRDPFFPNSARTAEPAATATNSVSALEVPALKCLGISGTSGHMLAIINNHTFAVDDEGDVITPSGKVHLRCLEIRPNSVKVEVNGHIHRIEWGME